MTRIEPRAVTRADLEGPSQDTPEPGMVRGLDPIVVRHDALASFDGRAGIPSIVDAVTARTRVRLAELRFTRSITMRVVTTRQRIRFGAVHISCPNREFDARPCDPDPREGTREDIPDGPPVVTTTTRAAVLDVDFVTRPVYRFRCEGADAVIEPSLDPMFSVGSDVQSMQTASRTEYQVEAAGKDAEVRIAIKTSFLEGDAPVAPRYAETPFFSAARDPWIFTTVDGALRYAAGKCR